MRSLIIAILLVPSLAAAGDRGWDWDPPPEPNWEVKLTSILQGQPQDVPYAGISLGLDHRVDGPLWGGFAVAVMGARQFTADRMPLPTQAAAFAAATTRLQLAHFEDDGVRFEAEIRAELGTAVVTYDGHRSAPVIGSAGLTGRFGGVRTTFLLSFGYAFAFAGSRDVTDPSGLDVRFGIARRW